VIIELVLAYSEVLVSKKTDAKKNEATCYYYLPTSILKVITKAKVAVYKGLDEKEFARLTEQSFTVTSETVADTGNLYLLNYKGYAFTKDDITFNINEKGLLSEVKVEAEDLTADIVKTIAEASKTILSPAALKKMKAPVQWVETREYTKEVCIPPEKLGELISWTISVILKSGIEEVEAGFTLHDVSLSNTTDTNTDKNNNVSSSNPPDSKADNNLLEYPNRILSRPVKNMTVKIEPVSGEFKKDNYVNLTIVDKERVIYLPVTRSAFVKRNHKLTLTDGILSSHQIIKPSSLEGFLSIPIDIAKVIVSIPAQLLSLKINYSKKQKDLLEAEKNRLDMQKQLDQMKKEIEELKKNTGDITP
jgi:hypothetical protein